MKIGAIVLAAGSSSRLGRPKQLLRFKGETLLFNTLQTLLQTDVEIITTVLGAGASNVQVSIQHLPIEIIENPNWASGQGSSIKKGLLHLLEKTNDTLDAVIIVVCDQPLLTKEHIDSMISSYRNTQKILVGSYYNNTVGVPTLFSEFLFPSLLNIQNKEGAKKIIQQYFHLATFLNFPEGSFDIDTQEDYNALLTYNRKLNQEI